jgi:predicted nucleic acid-binding protein
LNIYADTTVFVSFYITDQHSVEVHRLMARHPELWLTPFHRVEWSSAVAQHVFRGEFSEQESAKVYRDFLHDRQSGLWREIALPSLVFETAVDLAERHTPHLGVRALDTLHVAAALELKAERFWTFDDRQKKLAKAVGLKTT